MMGYMGEFAQEIAEIMGLPEIDDSVLRLGQRILVARELPLLRRLSENMRIAKYIRAERFIKVCSWCKRVKVGDEYESLKCTPTGKQTAGMCEDCYEAFKAKQTA